MVFVASRMHRNSSFYDAYWSVLPPYLAVYWWSRATGPGDDVRPLLVIGVVFLWAVRLTGNWVIAFPGCTTRTGATRCSATRPAGSSSLVDLFAIHVIPTIQVFLGMVPVYVAVARPGRDLGWLDGVALVVGLGAVALETVADVQMRRFVRTQHAGCR